MIAGAEAPAAAPDLVAGLAAAPDIARHIALAERVGGRRWDLLTHDGVRVRLPEGAAGAGLARLVALERRESVLRAELEVVDLRGAGVVLRARVQAPVRAREV